MYFNNVGLFGGFCCVNVLFYQICYVLSYVYIFISFVSNLQDVLYVLVCLRVHVVFYVCKYMCMFTMYVCLAGFVILTCCSVLNNVSDGLV